MMTTERPRTRVWHSMTTLVDKALGIRVTPRWGMGPYTRRVVHGMGMTPDDIYDLMGRGKGKDGPLPEGPAPRRERLVGGLRIIYVDHTVLHVTRDKK